MELLTNTQRTIAQAANGAATSWTGTPRSGIYIRPMDWPRLAIGAFFMLVGGLILFSSVVAPASNAPGKAFPIAFLVFWLAAALSQTILPVIFAAMARARTYYALTTGGYAIIVTDFFGTRVKRVFLPALDTIELNLRADGSGTISFGRTPSGWFAYHPWGGSGLPPAFENISDAARAYDLCMQLQRSESAKR